MSESGDYTPAPWTKGHDFKDAYKAYDAHVGRSYSDAAAKGKDAKSLVEANVKSDSKAPVVIGIDVTGSMGDWPKTIFSKLPYLEHEMREYLGEDAEISFCAIGDVHSDQYPLQVRKFVKGPELANELKELVIEGGGGAQYKESYEMGAYYYARHCDIPNAVKPIFIFIGDEGIYDAVDKSAAKKLCGDDIDHRETAHKIFNELKRRFSVYAIRKTYGSMVGDTADSLDRGIQAQWEKLVGSDRIAPLNDPNRVVDVIFGIFAKEAGRIEDFENELKERQLKDRGGDAKVSVVMKALKTIHKLPAKSIKKLPAAAGASVTRRKNADSGSDSISLLE